MEQSRMYDKREEKFLIRIDKENYLIKQKIGKINSADDFNEAFAELNDLRERLYCLRRRIR